MKLFKIHTEENGKDVNFGIYGVYADNEEDAIKYAETKIVADFLSIGYKVEVGRRSKRSIIYSIIYVWDNDEDTKYRRIVIWAIEKEKENTINKVKNKEQKMTVEKTIELMKNEKRCIIKADTCDRDCTKCELLKKTEDLLSAYDMVIKTLKQQLIIDKIRAEIEQSYYTPNNDYDRGCNYGLYVATQIIDHYKAESEDKR